LTKTEHPGFEYEVTRRDANIQKLKSGRIYRGSACAPE